MSSATLFPLCVQIIEDFLDSVRYVRSRVKVKTVVFTYGISTCIRISIRRKKLNKWESVEVSIFKINQHEDLHFLQANINSKEDFINLLYMHDNISI